MGHGFSGTRDLGLHAYAQRFAVAGLAVLVFDYRHFGASGCPPRQMVHGARQQEDYRAAVRFARGLEGVDPSRIALWGTSFSGSHVIAIAATDPRIAALVAQVAAAWRAVRRAPRGEIRRYPVNHFAVYHGEAREKVIADQLDFLRTHLLSPEQGSLPGSLP